jgi:hypothetical protein
MVSNSTFWCIHLHFFFYAECSPVSLLHLNRLYPSPCSCCPPLSSLSIFLSLFFPLHLIHHWRSSFITFVLSGYSLNFQTQTTIRSREQLSSSQSQSYSSLLFFFFVQLRRALLLQFAPLVFYLLLSKFQSTISQRIIRVVIWEIIRVWIWKSASKLHHVALYFSLL